MNSFDLDMKPFIVFYRSCLNIDIGHHDQNRDRDKFTERLNYFMQTLETESKEKDLTVKQLSEMMKAQKLTMEVGLSHLLLSMSKHNNTLWQ